MEPILSIIIQSFCLVWLLHMHRDTSISHRLFFSVCSVHNVCVFGVYGRAVQHRIPCDLYVRHSIRCLAIQRQVHDRTNQNVISKICLHFLALFRCICSPTVMAHRCLDCGHFVWVLLQLWLLIIIPIPIERSWNYC